MPPPPSLGDLELYIVASALRLGADAYGATIRQNIRERAGRDVSIGSLYAALGRLEDKGLIRTSLDEPRPVQGGRARRSVEVTPAGRNAVRQASESLARLLEGVSLGARA
jgi:PadR family transcriptional regulator